jgi:exopolyphosphatase/guanosine-5'-triphosphate,3'-diphosphate pyrophosphatase
LHSRTLDARISAGISRERPALGEEGMARALEAIRTLLADADTHGAQARLLVATSAVRDATNGAEFRDRVRLATGQEVRILSGTEEANLIGRGLTSDPGLRHLRAFYVFDLGGGSLECLAFSDRAVRQAVSLPLGCVRLTEKFVADSAAPLTPSAQAQIAAHVRTQLASASFAFSLPSGSAAVGTGGTVACARAILGAKHGVPFHQTTSAVTRAELRELLDWIGGLPLAARREIPGLPPARADVFPAALATLDAVAEIGGITAFHHSLCNLRYGLAAEALSVAQP